MFGKKMSAKIGPTSRQAPWWNPPIAPGLIEIRHRAPWWVYPKGSSAHDRSNEHRRHQKADY
jgi:hypothetical protein